MKKLMIVAIAGLLVFALVGTVLAYDEEEKDISKKHKNWLGKVMVGQINNERVNVEGSVTEKKGSGYIYTEIFSDPEMPERGDQNPPSYIEEARKVIAEQIGVNWHAVKVAETVGLTPSNLIGAGGGHTCVYYLHTTLVILKHGNDEYYVEVKETDPIGLNMNFTYTILEPDDPRVGVGKTILTLRDQMGSSYGLIYKGYMKNEDGSISVNFLDSNNGYAPVIVTAFYDSETGSWLSSQPITRTDFPHPIDNDGDGYADGDPNAPIYNPGPIAIDGPVYDPRPIDGPVDYDGPIDVIPAPEPGELDAGKLILTEYPSIADSLKPLKDTREFGRNPETKEEKKWIKDVTKEVCETLGVDKKDVNFVGLSEWATNGGTWGDYAKPGDPRIWDMPSGFQLAFIVDGKLYLYRAYGIGNPGTLKEVPFFSTGGVSEAQLIPGEPLERKELEAQLMLKRGSIPTVPQMADQPKEAVPLQKKQ